MRRRFLCIFLLLVISPFCAALSASEDQTDYFAVMIKGKRVGYFTESRIVKDGKVTTTRQTNATLKRFGEKLDIKATEICTETTQGQPISFKVTQNKGSYSLTTEGSIKDGVLILDVQGVETALPQMINWPQGALLFEGARLLTKEKGLEQGTVYTAKVFDLDLFKTRDEKVVVGQTAEVELFGKTFELTEITTSPDMRNTDNPATITFYDSNFNMKKTSMPFLDTNIETYACDKDFALSPPDEYDIMDDSVIKSPEPIKNIKSAKSIKYHIVKKQNAPDIRFDRIPQLHNQGVQLLSPDEVIITVAPVKPDKNAKFPYKGKDPYILEMLKSTEYINRGSPLIIKLAKNAIKNTKNSIKAAQRIELFVAFHIINRTLEVGYATAAEVAQTKKGDCTEFAVLTAAMLRTVGIPARVVTGLTYGDQWEKAPEGFVGHAWVEAYIGDKWIGVDSALRTKWSWGYDAGHIALAVGSGDPDDFKGPAMIGKIEIKKIEIEY